MPEEEGGSDSASVGRPSTCGSNSSDDFAGELGGQAFSWPALDVCDDDSGPEDGKAPQGTPPFAQELKEEIRRRKSGGRPMTPVMAPQRPSSTGSVGSLVPPPTSFVAATGTRLKAWLYNGPSSSSPPWLTTASGHQQPLTPVREAGETPYKNGGNGLSDSPPRRWGRRDTPDTAADAAGAPSYPR